MNHTDALHDTAKAALPIGGGVAMQYLHVADEVLTFVAHGVGAVSAVIGFWWLVYRIRRDLKSKTPTE